MKKSFILPILLFISSIFYGQVNRPKLVVGIIVDQMRTDYLYRFNEDFGQNGFKRLLKDGFNFKNTHYNYMPTYTAPGHSSVYTGTTPAIHGIVSNSWFHKTENKWVYCTGDDNVKSIGTKDENDKAGKMSPNRLKATTVTDALKLGTNSRGKVISISAKDRGAILPGGHFADAAFWMDKNGLFISSSFYVSNLPKWVKDYNSHNFPQKFIDKGWSLLKPISDYDESLPDDNPYEAVFEPKKRPTFPYNLKEIASKSGDNSIIKSTPYGNTLVRELGEKAIENELLGTDDITDFLALSFSSTDYVGHSFGPRSVEIQDTYLRLDLEIAHLLDYLDKKIGKGNYLLFLTADHAAAENPSYLSDMGYNVKNLDYKKFNTELIQYFDKLYGKGTIINYSSQNIYLNENLIKERKQNYKKILNEIIDFCLERPYVARVFTREQILKGNPVDYNLSLIKRGYDPRQNGDLVVLYDPQYMDYGSKGTSHGSTYSYDTHVPNLWYGWEIPAGESFNLHAITEIAPTLSQKLNIPVPNGNDGKLMTEILP